MVLICFYTFHIDTVDVTLAWDDDKRIVACKCKMLGSCIDHLHGAQLGRSPIQVVTHLIVAFLHTVITLAFYHLAPGTRGTEISQK